MNTFYSSRTTYYTSLYQKHTTGKRAYWTSSSYKFLNVKTLGISYKSSSRTSAINHAWTCSTQQWEHTRQVYIRNKLFCLSVLHRDFSDRIHPDARVNFNKACLWNFITSLSAQLQVTSADHLRRIPQKCPHFSTRLLNRNATWYVCKFRRSLSSEIYHKSSSVLQIDSSTDHFRRIFAGLPWCSTPVF